MSLPLPAVQFATLAVDSMLYGCFLTLWVVAATITFYRQKKAQSERGSPSGKLISWIWSPSMIAATGLFITVTGHWITLVYRGFHAFIIFNGGQTPATFYNDLTQYSERVINIFTVLNFLIWDAVLIFRMWVVWDKVYWVLAVPCCTYLGHIIAAIEFIYRLSRTGDGQKFFADDVTPWLTSYAALTCATNVYCTAFITFRIWKHDRKMKKLFGVRSRSTGPLGIFVESALAYTIWNIMYIVVYAFHSRMEFFAFNTWVPTSGISFLLIIIRVSMGYGYDPHAATRTTQASTPYPLTPLTVNISTQVRSDDTASHASIPMPKERQNIESEIAKN